MSKELFGYQSVADSTEDPGLTDVRNSSDPALNLLMHYAITAHCPGQEVRVGVMDLPEDLGGFESHLDIPQPDNTTVLVTGLEMISGEGVAKLKETGNRIYAAPDSFHTTACLVNGPDVAAGVHLIEEMARVTRPGGFIVGIIRTTRGRLLDTFASVRNGGISRIPDILRSIADRNVDIPDSSGAALTPAQINEVITAVPDTVVLVEKETDEKRMVTLLVLEKMASTPAQFL